MAQKLFDILEEIDWSAEDFSDDAFKRKVKRYMGAGYKVQTWDINDEWCGDMVEAADAVSNFIIEVGEGKKVSDIQTALFQTNDYGMAVYVIAIKAE